MVLLFSPLPVRHTVRVDRGVIFSSMKSSLRPVSLQSSLSMICHTENYPREVGSFASTGDSERGKSADPPPVRCRIRWNMVFTWQAPIMLLSYAVIAFLVGISVYIITPLYTNDQSLGGKPVSVPAHIGSVGTDRYSRLRSSILLH